MDSFSDAISLFNSAIGNLLEIYFALELWSHLYFIVFVNDAFYMIET